MFTNFRKVILLLGILISGALVLSANPLLGSNDDKAPEVRPPSSGGFMVESQLKFRELIGERLEGLEKGNNPVLFASMMGFAFLYGLLHAAGPGHRKTVIFSMFLTRKAKWNEPLFAALVSAAVHGGTAVVLILFFQVLFNRIRSVDMQNISSWLEGISYTALLALSLWFLIRAIAEFSGKKEHLHITGSKDNHGNIYATLAASSFFPCPGVIMILTFSSAVGVLKTGILAVISLSAGMGFTISLAAYLAYFGREGLFLILKEKEKLVAKIANLLEMGSYIFLFIFSFWMVYPFLLTLIR